MLKRIGAEEGGEFKAIASGTLPCGKPVIVNADGTVSVAAETDTPDSAGTPVVFESADSKFNFATFDSNSNKVVIAYRDDGNSDYGTAVVGTVSGNSISFGTPVVFESADSADFSAAFDSNSNKVVISYSDLGNNYYGTAIVGTVSGTSISFGTPVVFESATIFYTSTAFDSNSNKVVIAYRDAGNSDYGTAIVGTVSGTSISFGSATVFESANSIYFSATFDSNSNKVVIAYQDYGNNNYGTAVVGTVSGTSISFGTPVVFNGTRCSFNSATFDSNLNKVVIAFQDSNNSDRGAAVVGTVSGTSISFGSPVVFESAGVSRVSATFDSNLNKVVIAYQNNDNNNYGTAVVGTVSGTSISFGSATVFESANSNYIAATFDSNSNKVVIAYQDVGNNSYGTSVVFQTGSLSTNLTSENYIGMSRGVAVQTGSASTTSSTSTFESATTSEIFSAYDTNSDRVVIAYRDHGNNDYGTAIVGTVSGSSISFGTPVIYHSNLSQDNTVVFDSSNNKIVISWKAWDASNNTNGTSIVGTVSGTAISFGSAVQFNTTETADISSVFDSSNNKVVVSYRDASNSSHGTSRVGTVSGTSISFGSEVVFESAQTRTITSVFDSNANKVVISYYDAGNSNYGTSIVGTVSGTSISFGSPVLFGGGTSSNHIESSFDTTANKVVISYVDVGDSDKAKAVVGTVSGTSISFGSPVLYNGTSTGDKNSIVYDSSANRHVIFFSDGGDSYKGKVVSGLVSGTSISFTDAELIADGSTQSLSATYDPDSSKTILSFDNVSNNYGVSVLHTPSTIATTRGEVAGGGNASMDIIGSVSDNQIGLTAGQQYFVQTDGTISTTAGSPSVLAGTAISATELVVKT